MAASGPFKVEPLEVVVAAGATQTFTVSFHPVAGDTFYSRELECYISFIEDRQARPTEPELFTRPWHLMATAIGHTFPPSNPLPPKLEWESERVLFASAKPGEVTRASALLTNHGEATVKFAFDAESTAVPGGGWECTPMVGLVRPGGTQLFNFDLHSTEPGAVEVGAVCVFNNDPATSHRLLLVGSMHEPAMELENSCRVYVPPTLVGTEVAVEHAVRNSSLVPVQYQWCVPEQHRGTFAVWPEGGSLTPNQRAVHTWRYTPTAAGVQRLRVPLVILDEHNSTGGVLDDSAVTMPVAHDYAVLVAECTTGGLVATPAAVQLENKIVGRAVEFDVHVFNPGPSEVRFTLAHEGGEWLHLSFDQGVLPPGAERRLRVSVESPGPTEPGSFQCRIFYELQSRDATVTQPRVLTIIDASFVQPKLVVSDARAAGISKGQLWSRLGLTDLNCALQGDCDADECVP
jgi:hypothetical protein